MTSLIIDEKLFKKIATIVLIAVLVFLTFLILKPILLSTIFGLILAFMFYPIYKKLRRVVKNKNVSALIICVALIVIILLPIFLLIPVVIEQSFEVYTSFQKADVLSPFKKLIPNFLASQELSRDLTVSVNSFIGNITSSFLNNFTEILLNSPRIFLHIILILFVFFFGLRDGNKLVSYIQDISPLSKESEEKVFKQFKDITQSVIFGQFIVGLVQGVITGIGLFIFGVPNALLLTLLATLVGVFPIIGPWLVWVPVDIYLFLTGRTTAGIGFLIFGLVIISWVDNLVRPYIVSKKTKINPAIILVSMLGGLLMFGILGIILGPLIISYLLLLLEFYRKKKSKGLVEPLKDSKI